MDDTKGLSLAENERLVFDKAALNCLDSYDIKQLSTLMAKISAVKGKDTVLRTADTIPTGAESELTAADSDYLGLLQNYVEQAQRAQWFEDLAIEHGIHKQPLIKPQALNQQLLTQYNKTLFEPVVDALKTVSPAAVDGMVLIPTSTYNRLVNSVNEVVTDKAES